MCPALGSRSAARFRLGCSFSSLWCRFPRFCWRPSLDSCNAVQQKLRIYCSRFSAFRSFGRGSCSVCRISRSMLRRNVAVSDRPIVKNAFRIVGLSLLANYVDPTFITDSVWHRSGGIPLFLLSLVVLFSLVWLLRRSERKFGYYIPD